MRKFNVFNGELEFVVAVKVINEDWTLYEIFHSVFAKGAENARRLIIKSCFIENTFRISALIVPGAK